MKKKNGFQGVYLFNDKGYNEQLKYKNGECECP